MKEFFRTRLKSFSYAFAGWKYLLATQPNTWIYVFITLAVVLVSFWLKLGLLEWAVLSLTIALVWGMEMVNTAVEALVDLATEEYDPLAKTAKDVAAGAVFFCAIMAVIIGLLVIGPPLLEKFRILIPE